MPLEKSTPTHLKKLAFVDFEILNKQGFATRQSLIS